MLKGLGKLGRLATLRTLKEARPAKPEAVARPETPWTKGNPLEEKAQQGVIGSLPERILWRWLELQRIPYEAQVAMFGGRRVKGGLVVDFVAYGLAARPVALRIQGEYWHGQKPGEAAQDDAQAVRMRQAGLIVVDLWESDVYRTALLGDLGELVRRQLARVM